MKSQAPRYGRRACATVAGRSIAEMPALQYYVFHRDRSLIPGAADLKAQLLAAADVWQERSR